MDSSQLNSPHSSPSLENNSPRREIPLPTPSTNSNNKNNDQATMNHDDNEDHTISPIAPPASTPISASTSRKQNTPMMTTTTPSSAASALRKKSAGRNHSNSYGDVPDSTFFLIGAPPSVSIAAKTTTSRNESPSKKSNQQQNASSFLPGSENFFKQHISFIHDQPGQADFVPQPGWFQNHNHQEFLHLQSSAGSSKIDRHHQNFLHPYSPGSTFVESSKTQKELKNNNNNSSKKSRPMSDDDNDLVTKFHSQHRNIQNTPALGRTNQSAQSQESLQNSLNALRRKQAIRTALEEGRVENDDDEDGEDIRSAADYWMSPSQQEQSERRIGRSSSATVNSMMGARRPTEDAQRNFATNSSSSSRPPSRSLIQKLKAFGSAEEFGEELIFSLLKDLSQSLAVGIWILLKKIGNYFKSLGYFMLFGSPMKELDNSSSSADEKTQGQVDAKETASKKVHSSVPFPSPFPQFYRESFFSTWSPHELLETRDLAMTNAFLPTPLPAKFANNSQKAADMLRPTPAPPFWWLGMMEISGRHFIEAQWSQALAQNILIPSSREAREMWMVHEEEIMKGHDLVRRVERRGGMADDEDGDDDVELY